MCNGPDRFAPEDHCCEQHSAKCSHIFNRSGSPNHVIGMAFRPDNKISIRISGSFTLILEGVISGRKVQEFTQCRRAYRNASAKAPTVQSPRFTVQSSARSSRSVQFPCGLGRSLLGSWSLLLLWSPARDLLAKTFGVYRSWILVFGASIVPVLQLPFQKPS